MLIVNVTYNKKMMLRRGRKYIILQENNNDIDINVQMNMQTWYTINFRNEERFRTKTKCILVEAIHNLILVVLKIIN